MSHPHKSQLVYRIATEPHEFELIHELNYRTFVEEIPQHGVNGERRLVDRFHFENTYIVCLAGERLAGMVALRDKRPFSLDAKLPQLQSYLPAESRPFEIRLLAIARQYRNSGVLAGLVARVGRVARLRGYNLALISGTTRQLKLYGRLGFQAFGPRVGSLGAEYQPMMLTPEGFEARAGTERRRLWAPDLASFLPGPVEIDRHVHWRFVQPPLSHRCESFRTLNRQVRRALTVLTRAPHAAVLVGSGTLANDVVAGQLSSRVGRGLILTNGEFGERLVDHASRWKLNFDVYKVRWGQPFDPLELSRRIASAPSWVWLVQCETSTGMLNDLAHVQALSTPRGAAVCVDSISSVGTMSVDFSGVEFATAVSGKALGSLPGLAIVFHRLAARTCGSLPRYLDLALYSNDDDVPFTHSSNLLSALASSLKNVNEARYAAVRRDTERLRDGISQAGLRCVTADGHAAPGIVTIELPRRVSADHVSTWLAADGYLVAHSSKYLAERGWIQIALMGAYSSDALNGLLVSLTSAVRRRTYGERRMRIAANSD